MVSGAVCNEMRTGQEQPIVELLLAGAGAAARESLSGRLQQAFEETRHHLGAARFDFELLLPGETASISERAEALADWCRGFVLGLLHNRAFSVSQLPGDAAEIVRDIMAICEAEGGAGDPEQEERALFELTEYVRIGVQLVYMELNAGRQSQNRDPRVQ